MSVNKGLFSFIDSSPTAFHTVESAAGMLEREGFTALSESGAWHLAHGKGYYVTRNTSSLIAFRIPDGDPSAFMAVAVHSDSPMFRVKKDPVVKDRYYARLSTEPYGGMLMQSWLDRPLGIAGRAVYADSGRLVSKNVKLDTTVVIPSVAIHMNRDANSSASFNPAVDMLPLYSNDPGHAVPLDTLAAKEIGCEKDSLRSLELFVYSDERGREWDSFISSPRLDDLQCAYGALRGFIDAGVPSSASVPVYCLFDNEEVGSGTKHAAASTFFADVLKRIDYSLGADDETHMRRIASSFMVSADNAHAVHPNHPEYADKNNVPRLNGGIVIKHNASMKYATDAVSEAFFREICDRAGVPVQYYSNRADLAGGSTLGNIADRNVSVYTADIGLAQLSMHSAYETAGAYDTGYLVTAAGAFYNSKFEMLSDGCFGMI